MGKRFQVSERQGWIADVSCYNKSFGLYSVGKVELSIEVLATVSAVM